MSTEQLFLEALALPSEDRADLIDRLIASTPEIIAPEIERAHLEEVQRRIARIESGETELIDGETALAEGRALLANLAVQKSER